MTDFKKGNTKGKIISIVSGGEPWRSQQGGLFYPYNVEIDSNGTINKGQMNFKTAEAKYKVGDVIVYDMKTDDQGRVKFQNHGYEKAPESNYGNSKYAEVSPEIQKRIIKTTMLDLSVQIIKKFKYTRDNIKELPGVQKNNIYGITEVLINYVDEKANHEGKFSKDNAIAAQSSLRLAVEAIDVDWMLITDFLTLITCADRFYTFLTE